MFPYSELYLPFTMSSNGSICMGAILRHTGTFVVRSMELITVYIIFLMTFRIYLISKLLVTHLEIEFVNISFFYCHSRRNTGQVCVDIPGKPGWFKSTDLSTLVLEWISYRPWRNRKKWKGRWTGKSRILDQVRRTSRSRSAAAYRRIKEVEWK